jgi:RHS repeat-associated protein
MSGIRYKTVGTSEPTQHAHYLYDAAGVRVKKLVRVQGGSYTSTVYIDGMFEFKTNGTDEQNTLHVMDDQSRIATIRLGDDFGDTTPAVKYNLEDHLGSSTLQLEDSGANINREEYYPFGETSFGSYAKKRYKYCGKERDEESGLYYYGARYYNAWTGRFVSVDPKSSSAPHLSPYHYTSNNPINRIDPDGMQDEPSGGGEQGNNATPQNTQVHSVQKGETLSGIAEQYGTSVDSLAQANNISNPDYIQAGQELNVPSSSSTQRAGNNLTPLNGLEPNTISTELIDTKHPESAIIQFDKPQLGAGGLQVSFTVAVGGFGFNFTAGFLGNANSEAMFISFGRAAGFEVSPPPEAFVVNSDKNFDPINDFEGPLSYNYGGGGLISVFGGGDAAPGYPEDKLGVNYTVFGGGVSFGAGASSSRVKTITDSYPSEILDPVKNPGARFMTPKF